MEKMTRINVSNIYKGLFEPLKAEVLTNCAISGLLDTVFLSHFLPRVTILSCIDVVFALFLMMSFLYPS